MNQKNDYYVDRINSMQRVYFLKKISCIIAIISNFDHFRFKGGSERYGKK